MARYLAWIAFATVLFCTVAAARPPSTQPGADGTARGALVGRVQLREGVVDLSLSSIGEGGAAHRVVRGLAGVMADVDLRRTAEHASPSAQASGHAPQR